MNSKIVGRKDYGNINRSPGYDWLRFVSIERGSFDCVDKGDPIQIREFAGGFNPHTFPMVRLVQT